MSNQLGPYELNTIVTGDARELAKAIPDESVDFVLWDPDYGVGVDYGNGEILDSEAAITFVQEMLPILLSKSRTGQAVMFWSGSVQSVRVLLAADLAWPIRYMGIWYKANGAGPTGNGFARRFETWFWLNDGRSKPNTEWHALPDVLNVSRVVPGHKEAIGHPSQKPVELLVRLIRFFTCAGDIVLDPTAGSGSTAVAAKLTGRRYLGFELNPDYTEMARDRVGATPVPLFVSGHKQLTFEVAP